ncbi:condensation domain-containing protein, partial [Candidatus Chloroploca sp. Khr17]|uniref:condensation domain-containing protein n=1 Tax=Candidatus Chloroploca sp. Khr17 TaxID=2496869 RepID=UPI001F119231
MTIVQFITQLEAAGIQLWLDENHLRYQAPKGALTADLRDQLLARKPEVIAFLRQAIQSVAPPMTPLVRDAGTHLPLSFAQQRVWFQAQLEANASLFNMPTVLHLRGRLDAHALSEAFRLLEARHEMLRTTFPEVDGQPYQQINPPSFALEVIDLSELPADQQQAEVARRADFVVGVPFDVAAGPLWRVSLLRLDPTTHVLLITVHHIVADGWSMGIMMSELSTLYGQLTAQLAPELPALPIQYTDYAHWQREWLQGAVLEEHLGYWRQQLTGAPPLLTLPTDFPRPAMQSGRGGHVTFT